MRIPYLYSTALLVGVAILVLGTGFSEVLAVNAPADDGRKLKAGDRDPVFLQRVNDTVRKGVQYILDEQGEDGNWKFKHQHGNHDSGCTAICLLACLKGGVNRFDEAIEKGFKWLKERPFEKTYDTALTIMAIEARWAKHKAVVASKPGSSRVAQRRPKIPPRDLDWIREAVRFLLDNMEYSERRTQNGTMMTEKDVWSYPASQGNASGDHSNTQYALLGLKSASRCGVKLPKDPFIKVIKHFIKWQEKSGPRIPRIRMIEDKEHGYVSYKPVSRVLDSARGWTYSSAVEPKKDSGQHPTSTTGSMTSVGVASIIICLSELGSRDINAATRSSAKRAVNDGLAWMDHNFTVTKNPGHPNGGWLYYYLYGLERAAVLANIRNLGKHDWYREGAEFLINHQNGKGAWTHKASCGIVPTTCLAILFLTKATVPVRVKLTGH